MTLQPLPSAKLDPSATWTFWADVRGRAKKGGATPPSTSATSSTSGSCEKPGQVSSSRSSSWHQGDSWVLDSSLISVLRAQGLGNTVDPLARLGVVTAIDITLLEEEDLLNVGLSVVTSRKLLLMASSLGSWTWDVDDDARRHNVPYDGREKFRVRPTFSSSSVGEYDEELGELQTPTRRSSAEELAADPAPRPSRSTDSDLGSRVGSLESRESRMSFSEAAILAGQTLADLTVDISARVRAAKWNKGHRNLLIRGVTSLCQALLTCVLIGAGIDLPHKIPLATFQLIGAATLIWQWRTANPWMFVGRACSSWAQCLLFAHSIPCGRRLEECDVEAWSKSSKIFRILQCFSLVRMFLNGMSLYCQFHFPHRMFGGHGNEQLFYRGCVQACGVPLNLIVGSLKLDDLGTENAREPVEIAIDFIRIPVIAIAAWSLFDQWYLTGKNNTGHPLTDLYEHLMRKGKKPRAALAMSRSRLAQAMAALQSAGAAAGIEPSKMLDGMLSPRSRRSSKRSLASTGSPSSPTAEAESPPLAGPEREVSGRARQTRGGRAAECRDGPPSPRTAYHRALEGQLRARLARELRELIVARPRRSRRPRTARQRTWEPGATAEPEPEPLSVHGASSAQP